MKAQVQSAFGGPEVLEWREVADPEPGPRDIVVEVHAVSVNPGLDFLVREGRHPRPVTLPHVLGIDPAGIVVARGGEVETPGIGDRVFLEYLIGCGECVHCGAGRAVACVNNRMIGVSLWGGNAERIVAPCANAVPVPAGLPFPKAVVLARHAPTAMFLLEDQARVRPGEWVLVNGATGGLGNACVQIAKAAGARVIAGTGSDERAALALRTGAEFAVNYRVQDIESEVMRITDGAGIDILCDSVGDAEVWPRALATVAKNGRVVTAGARGGGKVPLDLARLYTRRISILGGMGTASGGVARAFAMALDGALEPLIEVTAPLSAAADMHRALGAGEIQGKVVLVPVPGE